MSREEKSVRCPSGIELICPASEERFVVDYFYSKSRRKCLLGSVMHTALQKCNNSIMQHCMDGWRAHNNNCSAFILRIILDPLFRGPCSLHDLCYVSLDTKQDDCDDWFLHNMREVCNTKSFFSRILCKGTAYLVYKAVRGFGRSYFNRGQQWAEEHCRSKGC